eukprot:NODE_660_length_5439_cov_0.338577.p2 type:complete len:572 gc:universal NODE_660_length_5439_cov_0.338577:4773-3058(-)
MDIYLKYYPTESEEFLKKVTEHNIQSYFHPRIQFGTAGLREVCEIGTRYMNGITVVQMAQGLLQWHLKSSPNREVVVGHDHRHHSLEFALLTANIFQNANYNVYWLSQCATPLVSFASSHYKSLGVMVTASHNPKEYNGIKIYLENGCQLVNPFDKQIAESILDNLEITIFDSTSNNHKNVHSELIYLYTQSVLRTIQCLPKTLPIEAVYTPIHGIGLEMLDLVVKRCLPDVSLVVVKEQELPNPDFPTVAFPNPEEQGALDLAIETANRLNIPLVIANDPDQDRLALAEKFNGSFKMFNGDQLGIMLGYWLLKNSKGKRCVVSSVVSSKMFVEMAKSENVLAVTCLTGFKWMAATSLDLHEQGYKLVLAYEEALGYMVGDFPDWDIKDKDGVKSMVVLINLLGHIKSQRKNAFEFLDDLYQQYGYFGTSNGYITCSDKSKIKSVINKLRHVADENGWKYKDYTYPSHIGGFKVVEIQDLNEEYDSTTNDNKTKLPRQSSPMIQFKFTLENDTIEYGGAWLTLRASGTEPKLKYYIEVAGKSKDLETTKLTVDRKSKELEALVLKEWLKGF